MTLLHITSDRFESPQLCRQIWVGISIRNDLLEPGRFCNPFFFERIPVLLRYLELADEMITLENGVKCSTDVPPFLRCNTENVFCITDGDSGADSTYLLRHIHAYQIQCHRLLCQVEIRGIRSPKNRLQVLELADKLFLDGFPHLCTTECFLDDLVAAADILKDVSHLLIQMLVES